MFIRKMLFALLLLAVAAPISALAQFENILAITDNPDYYYGYCTTDNAGTVHTLYLVLKDPVNESFGAENTTRPVTSVGGFEFKLTQWGTVALTDVRYPVPVINVGEGGEYIVGFSEPVPVSAEGIAVLAEMDVVLLAGEEPAAGDDKASPLPCDDPEGAFYLEPIFFPSVEGQLAYLDWDDPVDPVVPAMDSFPYEGDAEHRFDIYVVGTEDRSWGGVKALYR